MFQKTFQIGLNGTGTRSVAAAVCYMGLRDKIRVIHGMPKEDRRAASTHYLNCLLAGTGKVKWFSHYDFVGELAAPLWKQIDEVWPGSRFVMNVRPLNDWIESTKRKTHVGSGTAFARRRMRLFRTDPMWKLSGIYQLITYGALQFTPRQVDRYLHHNEEVVEHFKGRPNDLLVFDCFSGDSWGKLSDFLGLPCPSSEISFPRINSKLGPRVVTAAARRLHRQHGIPGDCGK